MVNYSNLVKAVGSMLMASLAIAAPTGDHLLEARQTAGTLPPRQDPFYTAPAGYESAAPGTILRSRPAGALPDVFKNCSGAYQLNYRTTDSNGQPTFAVTTIFLPLIPIGSNSNLVSYQTAYDSSNVDDSPSYAFYHGFFDPTIPLALGLGWFVNTPDYEGPSAAFTAGVISGQATLDSIRAALNYRSTLQLRGTPRLALWGYSGGALASEWAAELQSSYAPELSFVGAALGGLTPNVTSVALTVNETPFSTLSVDGVLGQVTQDEAANEYLLASLKQTGPFNASYFLSARTRTGVSDDYANQDIFEYFVPGRAVLNGTPLRAQLDRDGQMGFHGVPQMPVYAYKAVADEISPVEDTDELVDRYCAQNARILYQRNPVGFHGTEAIAGLPRALLFLGAVFAGTYDAGTGCNIQTLPLP